MSKRTLSVLFFICSIAFGFISAAFAIENEYQNNLNNVDVKKTGDNNLNVTIYTDTPYKEPLKVIQKSPNQYVLLLPETSTSTSAANVAKSIKSQAGDVVQDVELQHYPYPNSNANNGYTKVTITTNQPVGIAACAQTQTQAPSVRPTMRPPAIERYNPSATATETPKTVKKAAAAPAATLPKQAVKQEAAPKKRYDNKYTQKQPVKKAAVAPQPIKQPEPVKQAVPPKPEAPAPTENTAVAPSNAIEETAKTGTNSGVAAELQAETQTPPLPTIEYEKVVDNNMKGSWREQNENVLLVVLLALLTPMVIVMLRIKTSTKKDKNVISRPPVPRKIRKRIANPSPKQAAMLNIMDNSNISWQERYTMMKKHELDELEQNLKKELTDEDIRMINRRHQPKKDLYRENYSKFRAQSKMKPNAPERRVEPTAPVVSEEDILNDLIQTDMMQERINARSSHNAQQVYFDEVMQGRDESSYRDALRKANEKLPLVEIPESQINRLTGIRGNISEVLPIGDTISVQKAVAVKQTTGIIQPVAAPQVEICAQPAYVEVQEVSTEPRLISKVEIAPDKGFYLTKYENQVALIGYIRNNVCVLKKFGYRAVNSLQVRLNERGMDKDVYIVKVDGYKALVDVSEYEISLQIEL